MIELRRLEYVMFLASIEDLFGILQKSEFVANMLRQLKRNVSATSG